MIRRSWRSVSRGAATSRSVSSVAMRAKISSFLAPYVFRWAWRRRTYSSTGSAWKASTSSTTRAASAALSPVLATRWSTRAGSTGGRSAGRGTRTMVVPKRGRCNFLPGIGQECADSDTRDTEAPTSGAGRDDEAMTAPLSPLALLDTDALIGEEDRAIRDTVRAFVDDRLRGDVADWYESGSVPVRDLALEFGKLGLLGMHLE